MLAKYWKDYNDDLKWPNAGLFLSKLLGCLYSTMMETTQQLGSVQYLPNIYLGQKQCIVYRQYFTQTFVAKPCM